MRNTQPTRIGPIDHIESLGFQTYGKERADPSFVVRIPVFKYKPVLALYKVELQALFGRLIRDEGTLLDRYDPNLFDEELEELLADYGPLIWPEPGQGKRDHLHEPQEDTRYPSDLIYPRDSAILKEPLRGIILCKKARPGVDLGSCINKTHKEARLWNLISGKMFTTDVSLRRKRCSTDKIKDKTIPRRTHSEKDDTDLSSDGSENSILGTKTQGQTRKIIAQSPDPPFKIELRLYRTRTQGIPIGPGPAWSYGNLMLTDDINSCEDLFALIYDKTEADCSFIIFQLPEDMSMEDRVRINRGSKESEVAFRCILGILQRARRFLCGPLHRSVELEIGLENWCSR